MYKLLIVDDETSVVDSLALTIPWEDSGIEEVYRAYSAHEALTIAATQAIDVLITDIRMPEMNGLELIHIIRKFNNKFKAIILSGHDEFNYAQKAIEYGAVSYLLKPVDFPVLIETVEKAIETIENEWKEISSYHKVKQALHESKPLLKSQLLLDLLHNKTMSPAVMEEKLDLLNINIKIEDSFLLMVVRLEEDFAGYDIKSLSLIEFAISNIAEEVFQDIFVLWHCISEQGHLVFLISSTNQESFILVDSLAVKLQQHVQKYLKGSLSICLSRQSKFPSSISKLYLSCVSSINRNVGKHKSFFLVAEQTPTIEQQGIHYINEPPLLPILIESGHFEEARSKIKRILFLDDDSIEPTQNQLFTIMLYLSSSFAISFYSEADFNEQLLGEEFEILLRKKSHLSKQRIWEWSERMIHSKKKTSFNQLEDSHQQISAKVRTYIQTNLAEGVSLQEIADHIKLHPVYLAKVYKASTGETIGNYLYQVRMERAVHLLMSTDLKISEVSSKLGFLAPPHFIKVFKKHYGFTPQEYRNQ